jgi:hypothetical protein
VIDSNNDLGIADGTNATAGPGGTNDIAAVFGDGQTAYAEIAAGLTTITPSSLAEIFDPSLAAGSIDATLLTDFLGLL